MSSTRTDQELYGRMRRRRIRVTALAVVLILLFVALGVWSSISAPTSTVPVASVDVQTLAFSEANATREAAGQQLIPSATVSPTLPNVQTQQVNLVETLNGPTVTLTNTRTPGPHLDHAPI